MGKTIIHINNMSKALTLADLTEALKPINLALKHMKEERTSSDARIDEIHNMAVENSTKLDLFNGHFVSIMTSLSSQPAPKKLVGRKGSVKKTPAKKTPAKKGKKTTGGAGEDEDVDNADNVDNTEDADVNVSDNEDGEVKDEDTALENEESNSKKKSVKTTKKAPAKKPVKTTKKEPTKKTTKKKETTKKQSKINKMQYFKKAYEDDSTTFDEFLTTKVKKNIETENKEKFESLEGAKLQKEKINAYYTYFRDNHSKKLDEMRDAYIAEHANNSGDADEAEAETADVTEADTDDVDKADADADE